jgi:vitellogenic carboxypeptidase-like protein
VLTIRVLCVSFVAGHYIPAFAYKILTENELGTSLHVNLQGVAIGDGLTCPCLQVEAGPRAAFDFGLINSKVYAGAKALALEASAACAASDWTLAHEKREAMESMVLDASGINKYDVRTFDSYDYMNDRMAAFFNRADTKALLGVPQDVPYGTDAGVSAALFDDIMQSQADKVPVLLRSLRVLLYQGQFDWKDGPFSNEAWINKLDWDGRVGYLAAERVMWLSPVEPEEGAALLPAGWLQSYGNLTECVINAAGHLAPMNQPVRLLTMITNFVTSTPFDVKH